VGQHGSVATNNEVDSELQKESRVNWMLHILVKLVLTRILGYEQKRIP
jgi:hypothetical protein